jgi:hypothetical protein
MYDFLEMLIKEINSISCIIRTLTERGPEKVTGSVCCSKYRGSYFYYSPWRLDGESIREYFGKPERTGDIQPGLARFNETRMVILRAWTDAKYRYRGNSMKRSAVRTLSSTFVRSKYPDFMIRRSKGDFLIIEHLALPIKNGDPWSYRQAWICWFRRLDRFV